MDTNPLAEEDDILDGVYELTGYEPVLGGKLTEKAIWVDESRCIGCRSVSYTHLTLPTKRIV